jgi:hypothetical protein
MGILDNPRIATGVVDLEAFDWASVPTHRVTCVWKTEPADGDCVRSYLIEEVGSIMVPRYTFIMPVRCIAAATMAVQRAALEIFHSGNRTH